MTVKEVKEQDGKDTLGKLNELAKFFNENPGVMANEPVRIQKILEMVLILARLEISRGGK